jgi:hypothetical protein
MGSAVVDDLLASAQLPTTGSLKDKMQRLRERMQPPQLPASTESLSKGNSSGLSLESKSADDLDEVRSTVRCYPPTESVCLFRQ